MVMLDSPGDDLDVAEASGPGNDEVVEVGLLLSARQLAALESAAHRHGLTAAQMLRRLLGTLSGQAEQRGADRLSTGA